MRVPQWVIPVLVVLFAGLGVGGARLLAIPSVVRDYAPAANRHVLTSTFVVDGVKCVDTAERAASQFQEEPGVVRFVAHASRNRVEITFDSELTDITRLREVIEGPVYDPVSSEYLFGVFTVIEVDGTKVVELESL